MESMGYRNITVKDDIYDRLETAKRERESFNALLARMLDENKPKTTLREARGLWADMTDAEEKRFREEFRKSWRTLDERIGQRFSHRKPAKKTGSR